jgi:2-dehydropantoate 2-reductase
MRIAVMGAGSIGTVVGALIAKSGQDVVLIDADEPNVAALNAQGATVKGFLDITVPVRAITPAQMEGIYDLVVLTTKQTFNDVALKQILPHLGDSSTVCTLQNGIPEESVATRVGPQRTIGGTVGFGATWLEPGVSMLTSTLPVLEKYAFDIGELDGQLTPRIYAIQKVLSAVGGCTVVPDFMAIRWAKLLMNATFSGMSAALGCTFGDVLENPDAMEVLAHIADETIKVARACGYRLAKMQGIDMESLELKPGDRLDDKMPLYRAVWGPHVKLKASMLQDLEKGRKTEIAYINGYVCRKGREKNVPTPYNDFAVSLVSAAELRKKVPDFTSNLEHVRDFLASKITTPAAKA